MCAKSIPSISRENKGGTKSRSRHYINIQCRMTVVGNMIHNPCFFSSLLWNKIALQNAYCVTYLLSVHINKIKLNIFLIVLTHYTAGIYIGGCLIDNFKFVILDAYKIFAGTLKKNGHRIWFNHNNNFPNAKHPFYHYSYYIYNYYHILYHIIIIFSHKP